MTRLRQRVLEDLQRRNYSPDTIRGYIRAVKQFAECFGRSPEHLGAAELRRYQLYLLHERKLALGTVENCISALRFLYKKTLKRRDLAFDDLPFPKQPHKLPTVISQDEVRRLIEAARHRMHRTILMLIYGTGMRRTEASRLKVSDIDSQRMVIHIHSGKGLRDRDVPLTPKLLEVLRDYWRWKKPRVYLFPSKMADPSVEQPISDKTVWNLCRAPAARAGIQKKLGPHTLRHCRGVPVSKSRRASRVSLPVRRGCPSPHGNYVSTSVPSTSGHRFSKSTSRCSPRSNRAWIRCCDSGHVSAVCQAVEGVEEPVGGWQRDLVNEILRRRDSTPVEGGDPARERVDEAVQLRVRKCAVDVSISFCGIAVEVVRAEYDFEGPAAAH
jgi:integrase/recombinase XerD